MNNIFLISLLNIGLLTSSIVNATCIKVTNTNQLSSQAVEAGYTAKNWQGTCDTCTANIGLPAIININNGSNFQPSGTILASSVGNFVTQASNVSYTPNQILYRCELKDANEIYEVYSTNGDDRYTGHNETSEVQGAYYDQAKNVAVRMTNLITGEYYSRYWKERKITSENWYQDNSFIYIPASAFSNVLYEMFKINDDSHFYNSQNVWKESRSQPRGYIALRGPGMNSRLVAGADHNSVYDGFSGYWVGAWSTWGQVTYVRGALCEISDYTPTVILPPVSNNALKAGAVSQAPFTVSLICERGSSSGTDVSTNNRANVAMGFLVNQPKALNIAQNLGLTTSGGGVTWLLDSNYGNSGVASGVGIRIYNSFGAALNLLPDRTSTGTGSARGWYGYDWLTDLVSSENVDSYTGNFIASLEAIKGETVTPGTVNAQLQLVISFQ